MRFVIKEDIPQIQNWFVKHGFIEPPKWFFSETGIIIPEVAAGFLYFTNSGIARIDAYISNPEAKMRDRREALRKITQEIIVHAKSLGVKMICCSSKIRSIQNMAKDFEFTFAGKHESFSKILNNCPLIEGNQNG